MKYFSKIMDLIKEFICKHRFISVMDAIVLVSKKDLLAKEAIENLQGDMVYSWILHYMAKGISSDKRTLSEDEEFVSVPLYGIRFNKLGHTLNRGQLEYLPLTCMQLWPMPFDDIYSENFEEMAKDIKVNLLQLMRFIKYSNSIYLDI